MDDFVCIDDYERAALSLLGQNEREFLSSGADNELTLMWNKEAFKRIFVRPRVLRNVKNRDLHTTILGSPVSLPIGISPTAHHSAFHPDGEFATAKGSARVGSCFIVSTMTTRSVEEIYKVEPSGLKWFQVYVSGDKNNTADNIKRAAKAGFKALVVTADFPVLGKRRCNVRRAFVLPPHLNVPMFSTRHLKYGFAGEEDLVQENTWDLIPWMKELTGLPVVVKGILTAEDAELAILHGADAILVSNHGGRQLDTVPATIDILSEIVKAVNGRVEVYLDGGVRTGTDVLKALALGARAVFVGRPIIWGLTCNGNQGVATILTILRDELSTAMALTGCQALDDIHEDMVRKLVEISKL